VQYSHAGICLEEFENSTPITLVKKSSKSASKSYQQKKIHDLDV
jgi:hypothetical protein